MRNRTSFWKRSLAALLSFVMLLGMVPALGSSVVVEAEAAPVDANGNALNYITLPITIRDFAADGMLFEYNEVNKKDTITTGGTSAAGYSFYENPSEWSVNDYYSFRLYDYGEIAFDAANTGLAWHCVICDGSGNVVDVLASGEEKETTYNSVMKSGYFSIWVWEGDAQNYTVLSAVTDSNKSNYAINFHYDSNAASYKMYIGYRYHENAWDSNYTGISYFDANTNPFTNNYDALYADCVICDSNGNVVKVIPAGTSKTDDINAMQSGYFALFATANDTVAQGILRGITEENKAEYQATFIKDNYYSSNLLYLDRASASKTFHRADTKGFGLLQTGVEDYINNLAADTIVGSTLISNGGWNSSTAPAALTQTLTSGAPQLVYGAMIRTDMVGDKLVDGKPVYTKGTVDYLADYMSQIMQVPWQNADGSYNTYHVQGVKMFNAQKEYVGPNDPDAVYDLAELLRQQIKAANGGNYALGNYNTSKEKFDKGGLRTYEDVTTWYDAAYFLLHNTWGDSAMDEENAGSDGYGMPMSEYHSLQLVQKTGADGKQFYTFNSAYDNAVYKPEEYEIYNTQTTDITAAQSGGKDFYTRGNKLPAARFNPLGISGIDKDLGYGMSGNFYGDLTNTPHPDWEEYYYTTNYNLSLEGHAQFVYHEDADQYFKFTGDDDVYLYINGTRVLDIGGAHSIAEVRININDVAEACGLEGGGIYSFDFFYLERHGTAANFGIETDIQIVDPAITTTKTGFQNGVNTGYNGYVDPEVPVAYEFGIENKSNSEITELTFDDERIGVKLTKDTLVLGESDITKLSVAIYEADGTVKESVLAPNLDEGTLKEMLKEGLDGGEKIVIYGFEHTIDAGEWERRQNTDGTLSNWYFYNLVNTTALSQTGDLLTGTANWVVQQSRYQFLDYHVYEWMGHGVTLDKDELVQPLKDALEKEGKTISEVVKIEISSASGSTSGTNINTRAEVNDDDSITYTGVKTGVDNFFYKVTYKTDNGGEDNAVIGVAVYSYDVANNDYVLDYGLDVELNGENFGLLVNDTVMVTENPNTTTATTVGISKATRAYDEEKQMYVYSADAPAIEENGIVEGIYGDFTFGATKTWENEETGESGTYQSLMYKQTDILDNTDGVIAHVQVLEDSATELTKFTGVAMYETVITAPANVVYYEENHPGITYVNEGENQWAHYETVDDEGNSVAGTEQSADQDSNYGSDPNYAEDKIGDEWDGEIINTTTLKLDEDTSLDDIQTSVIDYLNDYLGMSGQASNGTFNALEIKQTSNVMFFDFVGTGFEIISRTTQEKPAVINVIVDRIDTITDEETGEVTTTYITVRQKPVICESKGGDLYQVPIISITDLPRANYRVTIKAAAVAGIDPRILYIDGVRIYGPLSDGQALEYYNPEEYHAEFYEVKSLIVDRGANRWPTAIYMDIGLGEDAMPYLTTGTTFIEYTGEDGFLVREAESVEEYMNLGPNNELYFEGNTATSVIMFFATPIEGYPESARTIEIGAHRKVDSVWEADQYATLVYGSTPEAIYNEDGELRENEYEVWSGTEQYYTIDVNKLEKNDDGSYLVMIGTNGNDCGEILALTNLKVAGYTLSLTEAMAAPDVASVDDLSNDPMVRTMVQLHEMKKASAEEDEVQIPVNENLTISSASLKASSLTNGKAATLSVTATAEADSIEIIAPDGSVVAVSKCTRKVSGSNVTFQVQWTVTGTRGSSLDYTIRVYDADGLASVNTQTVTVTIK